jgi:hypothetical protein
MATYAIQKTILALLLVGLVHASEAQIKESKVDGTTPVKQTHRPAGPEEGMGIHGHWTVTIRNSDGTIASRHEFENSVTNTGKGIVLGFLTGSTFPMLGYVPSWELKIGEALCNPNTIPPTKSPDYCRIPVEAKLVVGGKVEMKGTVAIDYTGQIKSVATQITNTQPRGKGSPIIFSSRDLTQPDSASGQATGPINVQAGQNVDFVVDISIS